MHTQHTHLHMCMYHLLTPHITITWSLHRMCMFWVWTCWMSTKMSLRWPSGECRANKSTPSLLCDRVINGGLQPQSVDVGAFFKLWDILAIQETTPDYQEVWPLTLCGVGVVNSSLFHRFRRVLKVMMSLLYLTLFSSDHLSPRLRLTSYKLAVELLHAYEYIVHCR